MKHETNTITRSLAGLYALGDADPVGHGGLWIYVRESGDYEVYEITPCDGCSAINALFFVGETFIFGDDIDTLIGADECFFADLARLDVVTDLDVVRAYVAYHGHQGEQLELMTHLDLCDWLARIPFEADDLAWIADLVTEKTRPFDQGEIDDVFEGYLDCLAWAEYVQAASDPDSGSENHVEDSEFNWEKRSLKIMRERVVEFMRTVSREDFDAYCEAQSATDFGHDLYLTTHGHGAGFWDRGLGELGKRLTAIARMHREESWIYVYRNKLRIDA